MTVIRKYTRKIYQLTKLLIIKKKHNTVLVIAETQIATNASDLLNKITASMIENEIMINVENMPELS